MAAEWIGRVARPRVESDSMSRSRHAQRTSWPAWVGLAGLLTGYLMLILAAGSPGSPLVPALPEGVRPAAWIVRGSRWFGFSRVSRAQLTVVAIVLVAAALAAALAAVRNVLPRVAGWLVALLYLQWMVVAMSYGKVDHDRFAFLVALFVLPSVGRAALRSRQRTEAAGWALSMIALAVVATYTLASVAKIRFGGWDWADGATLTRAVLRRSTPLSEPLLDVPSVLHAAQYGILVMELVVAPLLLVRWRDPRVTWLLALGFLGFHLVTFSMITIIFLPHCVALLALLPLERAVRREQVLA